MIYELRTYVPAAGKAEALHRRFADHTLSIFERCGVESVGYWTDPDETLVYLVRFPNLAAQQQAWDVFKSDPEWQQVKELFEKEGPLTASMSSVTLTPTAYSSLLK
jgi:hypothetical protein